MVKYGVGSVRASAHICVNTSDDSQAMLSMVDDAFRLTVVVGHDRLSVTMSRDHLCLFLDVSAALLGPDMADMVES